MKKMINILEKVPEEDQFIELDFEAETGITIYTFKCHKTKESYNVGVYQG